MKITAALVLVSSAKLHSRVKSILFAITATESDAISPRVDNINLRQTRRPDLKSSITFPDTSNSPRKIPHPPAFCGVEKTSSRFRNYYVSTYYSLNNWNRIDIRGLLSWIMHVSFWCELGDDGTTLDKHQFWLCRPSYFESFIKSTMCPWPSILVIIHEDFRYRG